MESDGPGPWVGRREQVALVVLAGLVLLGIGRMALRRGDVEPLILASPTPRWLVVHVAGEVLVPGVYHLPPGSRWSDAVRAARGVSFLADLDAVNLAQPLRDGDRVYIPRVPDPVLAPDGHAQAPEGVSGQPRGGRPASVDVNAASAADLEALPGIGPVLAARIVEYRRTHGRFRRPEDLLEVEGIGPRLLERLRPLIQVR